MEQPSQSAGQERDQSKDGNRMEQPSQSAGQERDQSKDGNRMEQPLLSPSQSGGQERDQSESNPPIIQIPQEPAVVITEIPARGPSLPELINQAAESEAPRFGPFGEWMEGREVRKLYDGRYYAGTVAKYEPRTGWYRVVYQDGESEDLEWEELERIMCPIDVSVSLRSLASRVARRGQKKGVGKGRNSSARNGGGCPGRT